MRKHTLIACAVCLFAICEGLSQSLGRVVSEIDTGGVAYASIYVPSLNDGVSTNLDGEFVLADEFKGQEAIVSAVGYSSRHVTLGEGGAIFLAVDTVALPSLEISARKGLSTRLIPGKVKAARNSYFSGNPEPWRLARYFTRDELGGSNFIIDKISIVARSKVPGAPIQITLRASGEDGAPGRILHNQPIVISVGKKRGLAQVDLGLYVDLGSEDGVFVVLDWVDTPEHIYASNFKNENGARELRLAPEIAYYETARPSESWVFHKGQWASWAYLSHGTERAAGPFNVPYVKLEIRG